MMMIMMTKKYQLTILFACLFMVAMAGNQRFDRAELQRAIKTHAVQIDCAQPSADRPSSTRLLRQSLLERYLPAVDSVRIVKVLGDKIVSARASFLEIDDDGNVVQTDTASISLGWAVRLDSIDGTISASGFYGNFDLPIIVGDDGKLMIQYGVWSEYKRIGSARNRIDTIAYACPVPLEWLWGEDVDATGAEGTILEDGSVVFETPFAMFIEQVSKEYLNGRLWRTDTTTMLSPVYHDVTFVTPNGVNRFMKYIDFSNYQVVGFEGEMPVLPNGVGGIVPRPVDPRPIKPRVDDPFVAQFIKGRKVGMSLDFSDVEFHPYGTEYFPDGVGGVVPRPVDPRPVKPGNRFLDVTKVGPKQVNNLGSDRFTASIRMEPVYIFQPDDSTVMVYNIMGQGFVMNTMTLHADSTVTYPLQVLGYNNKKGAYTYNCTMSVQVDSCLELGCTGMVTPTMISLDNVAVYCPVDGDNTTSYPTFTLMLNGDNQFVIPSAMLLGDVNGDRTVNISDVTTMIDHLLGSGSDPLFRENAADVNHDGIVNISDVTTLIDRLLGNDTAAGE